MIRDKSVIRQGARLAKWFQVTISIKLLGVEILHLEFPPDSTSLKPQTLNIDDDE